MRKFLLAATVACGAGAFGAPGQAQLLGTSVFGTLTFDINPTNFYDPTIGFVPLGTDNQTSPTVTIDSNIEFGFFDGSNFDTADFTDNTLTVTDLVEPGNSALDWQQTFTDAAFTGLSLSTASDSFNPLVSATLVDGVVTVNFAGTDAAGAYTATFDLTGPVPEPASMALLATGLLGLGVTRRLRRN